MTNSDKVTILDGGVIAGIASLFAVLSVGFAAHAGFFAQASATCSTLSNVLK